MYYIVTIFERQIRNLSAGYVIKIEIKKLTGKSLVANEQLYDKPGPREF